MAEGTGFLRTTGDGLELVLVREFTAPREEIWAWVTESEKLETWFGRWTGEGGTGNVVELTLIAEDSDEPEQVTIIDCQPPSRLQVVMSSESGSWQLQVDLRPRADRTVLEFNQLIEQGDDISTIGPGWEYYLDRLVAARAGLVPPSFDEYYPALVEYYAELG
ncbi:MAG TPA: SRPBCC domain-containing protein [Actinotalea caeni]|uniref:SRPBCC domain-containing protein n=1 Tax=Actinotalea caeni TaxID=1348467 RepID=UPI0012E1363C|nr:SRPBCC domain-containing protein [Actinotalea caeni]HLV57049.1 SRPBCC domain-containing protein [Actinotalea caeni]